MSEKPHLSIPEVAERLAQQYPSSQIVGSVGRVATMGITLNEFKPSGVRRDIDICRFGSRDQPLPAFENDVRIDPSFEKWFRPESNGTWIVFPYDETLAVEVPYADDVFAPQEVSLGDSRLIVPLPQTLGAISTVQYIQRPKDIESMRIYNEYLDSREDANELPVELLQPFEDFRNELAMRKGYTAMPRLRDAYHAMIPERVRSDDRMRWVVGKMRAALSKM